MSATDPQAWLDKTALGAIGIFTLHDGHQITAEILNYDETLDALVLQPSNQPTLSIPLSHIRDFQPQPQTHSDPCRGPVSFARPALMATIFLCASFGSIPLFLLIQGPCHLQISSAITYTLAEIFLTFAATGKQPRFLFTCPAVRPELPHLLLRHAAFLIALFALQTFELALLPSLPDWWLVEDQKGSTPFQLVLLFSPFLLGFAQVYTNRALLKRAHENYRPL